MISFKQRHAVWQKITFKGILLPLFIFGLIASGLVVGLGQNRAQAATASTLNFQGRLLNSAGDVVPDGSYNIEFKIYDTVNLGASAPTVCSLNSSTDDCWWIESRSVSVQNGYYSVYLGEITPFGSSIPWDQDLWLTMNVNSDGEMTPRFKLTAVPYAFRAGALVTSGGLAKTADDLAQLSPAAIQTLNTTVGVLRLNQTGTGSLLQLQGNGTDVFTLDNVGNAVLGAGITVGNSSSTTAGTIRWNGATFEGYNGSVWASLGSSAVTPFVSKTKTVSETQNNVVNPTATLQADDQLFFSIGANETWNYRFVLQATVNATPDIKFSVTAPVGATCVNSVTDVENAVTVANLGCGVSSGNLAAVTATDVYEVVGSVTNGANAGVVTVNWAQNTANAANTIVLAGSYVEASRSVGGSSADVAFIQNGNTFGGLAVLGTNDANGLAFETNGVERLQILSTGEIRAEDDLIANRVATGTTGTTTGAGTNTTTLTLTADNFNVNDVVFIDNVGQDYYTRITVDPGTGSYTVSPAVTFTTGRTVTGYNVQNIGATTTDYTTQANRFFQGYFLGGVVVGAGSTTISDGSIESTTTLRIQENGGDVSFGGGLSVTGIISGDASGLTNVSGAAVDGATITALDASNISTGTLADARLSSNVTLLGNTFNGINQLVQLDGSGNLPALNGSALTNISSSNLTGALPAISGASLTSLNGTNISSGTLADARLSTNVTLLGNTFNGINQLVQLDASGNLPTLDGSALINISAANLTGALPAISGASLTSLNGTNISSGTVADARLSANVTLVGNSFNGINQLVQLNGTGLLPAIDASNLTNLSSANLTGALPAISGAALTTLNASNISSGTLADARLSTNVTLQGNTFNGVSQLVQLDGSGNLPALNGSAITNLSAANLTGSLPALSGSNLTSLNATNISSGTLADARLSSNVTVLGNTFNGVSQLVQLTAGGALPALNGSALTNLSSANLTGALPAISGASLTSLNGSNISSGTVADARLSTNVTLLGNTFNGINQLVQLDGTGILPVLNGSALTNLSSANLTGALPAISGASLTSLNGSNISSGTLADGRLSANVALLTGIQTFTGAKSFSAGLTVSGGTISQTGDISATGQVAGATIVGDGSGVTALSATNVSSGTLADGRLSTNVVLLTGSQTFTGTKTFTNSGLVLGQSTFSSSATVARAVSFPDEAGTVCLSNTNTCGYLRFAAGVIQTDATNNDVISINKTSATGNLINIQRSGTAVFTVANSGALQIQATNANALDVRNVGGTSYFSVDSNTGIVRVGPSAADATGVLFTFDTKNTTGDPAIGSLSNAQYYNSADNKGRCYEGGFWSDCTTNRVLGETTLGAASNTITVNLAANTEFLQCRIDAKGRSAAAIVNLRFNGDAGVANYGWNTYGIAAAAVIDAQDSSDSEIQLNGNTTGNVPFSANVTITNFADTRKAVEWTAIGAEAIGTDMNRYSGGGTWNNVVAQVSSVSFITSAGTFNSGSHAWCEGRNVR